jgi:hypothetical protein
MPRLRDNCYDRVARMAPSIAFVVLLGFLATAADPATAAQANTKDSSNDFLTFSGQILVLLGALLGAGGGLRYFLEPALKRRHLRKVMATGLWLSCSELRRHLEAIRTTLASGGATAHDMRDALLKIPRNDYGGRADWFVKTGYFSMITAYKIAAFSSWMKIYQTALLRALLTVTWSDFMSELFQKFDAFKIASSRNTVLWYNYIDAIGEKMIFVEPDFSSPVGFSEFCRKYFQDQEFREFFDQLHMFIHFMGRTEEPWLSTYQPALSDMISALQGIEDFLKDKEDNLLTKFEPKERAFTTPAELSKYLKPYS